MIRTKDDLIFYFEKEGVVIAGSSDKIIREDVTPWVKWLLPTLGGKQCVES